MRTQQRHSMFSYTVRCRFIADDRQEIADRWLAWLDDKHIADVIQAGAQSAQVFQMDTNDDYLEYEVRYAFASPEAFRNYESEHAPSLREDGLKTFPLELGLEYSRTTGVLTHSLPNQPKN